MLIGELMQCTKVSRDTIRHYEKIGLLHDFHFTRLENGYRDYNQEAVARVVWVKKAQLGGFTLSQIVEVADKWESDDLSQEAKVDMLYEQVGEIDKRIEELQSLQNELHEMIALCQKYPRYAMFKHKAERIAERLSDKR